MVARLKERESEQKNQNPKVSQMMEERERLMEKVEELTQKIGYLNSPLQMGDRIRYFGGHRFAPKKPGIFEVTFMHVPEFSTYKKDNSKAVIFVRRVLLNGNLSRHSFVLMDEGTWEPLKPTRTAAPRAKFGQR